MNELIVIFIKRIEDEALMGAVLRIYNNSRAVLVSAFATFVESVGLYFITNGAPTSFIELFDKAQWEYILVAFVVQHLFVASAEKFVRGKNTDMG